MSNFLTNLAKYFIAALAFVSAAIVAPAPVVAAGWQPNTDDEWLFDIRINKFSVGGGIRGYQTDTGICVDFADVVMAFELPVRIDKKSRRATGWLFEEARTFTLDRENNTVQIVNNRSTLAPTDIRDTPEGWCVNTTVLAKWLNVELKTDLSNSLLVMSADRKLPFEAAAERKARAAKIHSGSQTFDLKTLPQAKDPYRFWRTPSVDVVATVDARRSARNGDVSLGYSWDLFASGEIATASFDARLTSDNQGIPERLRLRAFRSDPESHLLGPLKATHFEIGDVSLPGSVIALQSTPGRGAYVTNRPLSRPDSFDRTSFRGELPEGWDAELYRNGLLIGFQQSRGDGRYEFLDIPLLYGQNRMEVVLYGPQGQERRDIRMIPVGVDAIPPQETYYWAGVQQTGADLVNFADTPPLISRDFIGLRGGFGFERGIDARTSVAASFMTSMFRGRRDYFAEGLVRRAIGPALLEVAGASNLQGGYGVRGQLLAQLGKTNVNAESVWQTAGFRSERLDITTRSSHAITVDHDIQLGRKTLPISLQASYREQQNGDTALGLRGRVSFNIAKINASVDTIWDQVKRATGSDPPPRLETITRLSGRIGDVRLRGEARVGLSGDTGFQESKITADWRAGEKSDWRAEIGYQAANKRGRGAFGYTRRFEKFALTARIDGGTDGAIGGAVSLALGFGPNPSNGGYRITSEKLASLGQAHVFVFQDENGDGIRQAEEPAEKSVGLTAGTSGKGKPTNEKGEAFIDGLQPFIPIMIGIDTESLPDPFIQPAVSGIVVTPRPGVPIKVEIPLVSAGEVSGMLEREDGKLLAGVRLELIDKKDRIVRQTLSEHDGYVLFEGVPYGQYRLRVAPDAATFLGLRGETDRLVVLDKKNQVVDLGTVIVRTVERIASVEQRGEADGSQP
jgi:hypothetical protein